jgi:ankyrin repeat protein
MLTVCLPHLCALSLLMLLAVRVQLLAHGATMDCCDRQGCTPLLVAAQYGFVEIIIYLLKAGASTTVLDNNQDSALHWAVRPLKYLLRI